MLETQEKKYSNKKVESYVKLKTEKLLMKSTKDKSN